MIPVLESPFGQSFQVLPQYYGFSFQSGDILATFQPSVSPQTPARDTRAVLDEMLVSKRSANRREIYIKSLRWYLGRFAEKHPAIAAVTSADVEAWLSNHPSQHTRATWLNRINTLFSFAVKHEYIRKNPCDKIERGTIEHRVPRILTGVFSNKFVTAPL